MYKMIVSDLDGTLLKNDKTISNKNIKLINEAVNKGVKFVIATGRIYESAKHYSESLDFEMDICSCNGAYTKNIGKVILEENIDYDSLEKIDKIAKKYDLHYYFYNTNTIYTRENKREDLSKFYPNIKGPLDFYQYEDIEEIKSKNIPIYKGIIVSPKPEILIDVNEELKLITNISTTSSHMNNIEINKKDVNKGLAVKKLAEIYDIDLKDIISIGDNINDIPMLEICGLSVAVKNSNDRVKKIADYETVSNEDDAIANIIEEFIL